MIQKKSRKQDKPQQIHYKSDYSQLKKSMSQHSKPAEVLKGVLLYTVTQPGGTYYPEIWKGKDRILKHSVILALPAFIPAKLNPRVFISQNQHLWGPLNFQYFSFISKSEVLSPLHVQ